MSGPTPFIMRKGVSTLGDLKNGYQAYFATSRNVFHVDANHGDASDSNEGTDPAAPLSTIAQAYANCTDEYVETIFVKGDYRYREDELIILKDGIRIIGSGMGCEWNRTDSQSGTYVVAVQASNVVIANIQISVNGGNAGIYWGDGGATNANSAMGLLQNCFIRGNWYSDTGSEGTIGVTVDGSSFGPVIRDNLVWGWGTGIDVSDGANRTAYGLHIYKNYITGKTYGIRWTGYGYTSVIEENTIWDWKSSVNMTYGITLSGTVGGVLVSNNRIGCANPVHDSGDLNYWVGNSTEPVEAASELNTISTATH